MREELIWSAFRNPGCDSFDLYARLKHERGQSVIAKPIELELHEAEWGTRRAPVLQIDTDAMQILFQSLWDAGLRPSNGEGNGGHIDSIKYHLEDMRKLAFNPPIVLNQPPAPTEKDFWEKINSVQGFTFEELGSLKRFLELERISLDDLLHRLEPD